MQLLLCLTVTAFAYPNLKTYELAIGLPVIAIAVTLSVVTARKFSERDIAPAHALRWLLAFSVYQLIVCAALSAFVWQSCHDCTGNEHTLLKFIATNWIRGNCGRNHLSFHGPERGTCPATLAASVRQIGDGWMGRKMQGSLPSLL